MSAAGRIAITGAAGIVGTALRGQLSGAGYRLRSLDIRPIERPFADEEALVADIRDQPALAAALAGCDAVVHLACCTTDAPWPDQVDLSIQGTIALFEAARAAGVRRVVYASSHHVVGFHPRGASIGVEAVLRPDSRYAVGKAFGEAAAALYADKYGFAVLAIRIGNLNDRPIDRRRLGNWISPRDLLQLVRIGLEREGLVFEVVYGVSALAGPDYDNAAAARLGYRPADDAAAYRDEVLAVDPPPDPAGVAAAAPAETVLGGGFAASEFVRRA